MLENKFLVHSTKVLQVLLDPMAVESQMLLTPCCLSLDTRLQKSGNKLFLLYFEKNWKFENSVFIFFHYFRVTFSNFRSKKLSVLIHNSSSHPNVEWCKVAVHFQEIIDKGGEDFEVITFIISLRNFFHDCWVQFHILVFIFFSRKYIYE